MREVVNKGYGYDRERVGEGRVLCETNLELKTPFFYRKHYFKSYCKILCC